MTDPAIVVQNFNKPDTLDALCKSLLRCDNRQQFHLIFWSDSAIGARKEVEYKPKVAEVRRLLNSFSTNHRDQFKSIVVQQNSVNHGTCQTCQIALDRTFQEFDFVVFSEDDTIFSRDALDWFLAMRDSAAFGEQSIWAIAGESIFFDGQRVMPDRHFIDEAKRHIEKDRLWEQFIPFDFIPSTCFATTREKWAQFSDTRGHPLGDTEVCQRCRAEGKKCLFPVVPRVKDVGMLHPDGYSVMIHSAENVTALKNCYLLSEDVRPESDLKSPFRPFDGDAGRLFWQSTLLNGFDRGPNDGPVHNAAADPMPVPTLEAARKAGAASDWKLALELWRGLKDAGVATVEVDTNIGLCLLKTGMPEQARAVIQNVLAARPDEAFAQIIMAYILEAEKDFNGAANVWNQLRTRDGLPDWMNSNAVAGETRCKAAAIAQKF